MKMNILYILLILLFACAEKNNDAPDPQNNAYRITKTVEYNGVAVDVVIDKPANDDLDVLIVYHGTVWYDSLIVQAANNALNVFKGILDRTDMMIVSIAYPEENLQMGDNVKQSEAGLLWVKHLAEEALGITVKKIFLAGHSQGGYIVTRLNTMHQTNGVIANAPGPLNLVFRCQLEEEGKVPESNTCKLLNDTYGSTAANPDAYYQRSLLNFTNGFLSDILFVQGMNDSPIQMYSWPVFKQQILDCTDCKSAHFLDLAGYGHSALFQSSEARTAFNNFINNR
jgi:hypothetical protein